MPDHVPSSPTPTEPPASTNPSSTQSNRDNSPIPNPTPDPTTLDPAAPPARSRDMASARVLLRQLEDLQESLNSRLEQLSRAIARLRYQASELERTVADGGSVRMPTNDESSTTPVRQADPPVIQPDAPTGELSRPITAEEIAILLDRASLPPSISLPQRLGLGAQARRRLAAATAAGAADDISDGDITAGLSPSAERAAIRRERTAGGLRSRMLSYVAPRTDDPPPRPSEFRLPAGFDELSSTLRARSVSVETEVPGDAGDYSSIPMARADSPPTAENCASMAEIAARFIPIYHVQVGAASQRMRRMPTNLREAGEVVPVVVRSERAVEVEVEDDGDGDGSAGSTTPGLPTRAPTPLLRVSDALSPLTVQPPADVHRTGATRERDYHLTMSEFESRDIHTQAEHLRSLAQQLVREGRELDRRLRRQAAISTDPPPDSSVNIGPFPPQERRYAPTDIAADIRRELAARRAADEALIAAARSRSHHHVNLESANTDDAEGAEAAAWAVVEVGPPIQHRQLAQTQPLIRRSEIVRAMERLRERPHDALFVADDTDYTVLPTRAPWARERTEERAESGATSRSARVEAAAAAAAAQAARDEAAAATVETSTTERKDATEAEYDHTFPLRTTPLRLRPYRSILDL